MAFMTQRNAKRTLAEGAARASDQSTTEAGFGQAQPEGSAGPDRCAYIADLCLELAAMAANTRNPVLLGLLTLAAEEATRESRRTSK